MYSAFLMMVVEKQKVPPEILPFVEFDAKRRGLELTDVDRVAILQVSTTQSFISIPLGKGLHFKDVEKELMDIRTYLDDATRASLIKLM